MKPAIVLSTDIMGLAVIRALGTMGVPIVAVSYAGSDMGYTSKYVTEKISAPHPEKAEDQFIDLLMKSGTRFSGGLLIPASDETLAAVSRHKDLLEQHYIVACTEWKITEQFIDKSRTHAVAALAGVPTPQAVMPRSIEEVARCGQTMHFPCLVKPRQSHRYYEHFRTKMVQVENLDQMVGAYKEAAAAGLEVMLQEIIPGDDSQVANYNSYFWNGEPLVEFTAQQIRKAPPEFGSPRVVMSKDIPEVIEPGRKILRSLGFYGYSCTEFKKDPRDGVYKLLEVNGRPNRSSLLALRCGINFPWLQYKHLVQGELPSPSAFRTGIYWIMLDKDVRCSVRYYFKERYSLGQYLRPYLQAHIFDILDWKDPKPFIRLCSYLVSRAIGASFSAARKALSIS